MKNCLAIAILVTCLILGTIPFALGATTISTTGVYVSKLYVGAPSKTPNQEYVQITNGGKNAVTIGNGKLK